MRRLVMCCDGTWNTPGQVAPSNVRRLRNALADTAKAGEDQLSCYQSGVGTESGGLSGWLLGGVAGVGLSRNVQDAYQWVTGTYRAGDKIALFGFSRGAYTARSLAGMIAACGLFDTTTLDDEAVRRLTGRIYEMRYRPRVDPDPGWSDGLSFTFDPENKKRIPVDFVGVWDTVGALGVPDTMGWLNLLDADGRHAFRDVKLAPHVRYGRHAVALDEQRGPFTPTLWPEETPKDQDVKQVWFPGSHMDVGGGHPETGLSDGALQWMIGEAAAKIGLGFRPEVVAQIHPDSLGRLHDDNQGIYGLLEPLYEPLLRPLGEPFFEPRPRATPRIERNGGDPALHRSAYERHRTPPIASGPYRHARALAPGESRAVGVSARDPWNWTGLYLDAGEYTFAARGRWTDLGISSGPAGTTGWRRFRPREAPRVASGVLGLGERIFRRVFRKPRTNFLLTRREETMPWMALIGVVANDAVTIDDQANVHEHQRIAIGAGTTHRVSRPGHLYAYANDAWGFYGNNRGSVQLEVTRNS